MTTHPERQGGVPNALGAGTLVYVKLILRSDCLVVSFHEDEGGDHEDDA